MLISVSVCPGTLIIVLQPSKNYYMFTRWPENRGDVNDVINDADGACMGRYGCADQTATMRRLVSAILVRKHRESVV